MCGGGGTGGDLLLRIIKQRSKEPIQNKKGGKGLLLD
jgi:hypothetical protein